MPDTHRKCRVFETGNWGWVKGEDATYSCSGTSGYCLWFLMTQTILQVRLLGFGIGYRELQLSEECSKQQ